MYEGPTQGFIEKSLTAQRLGNSVQAHKNMLAAYLSAETSEHAARLFSHQLLLRWSFADPQTISQNLQSFYNEHISTIERFYTQQKLTLASARPLRVGYLSPDLRSCSAARLIGSVFQHSPKNTQSIVYDTGIANHKDPVHQKLHSYMTRHRQATWKKVAGVEAKTLAHTIYNDKVDILIDLAGHTSVSSLKTLAYQAAPLQVSGLTFNGGVALGSRCLRVTDAICTPYANFYPYDNPLVLPIWISSTTGLPEQHFEKYQQTRLEILKKRTPGHWIMGCAHHPGRLSKNSLQTWGQLLKTLPYSKLHLKHHAYANNICRKTISEHLIVAGAKRSQILFSTESPYFEYLNFYQNLDLSLDPFPYHGGLVSCDSLQMGVPLISESSWMRGGESLSRHMELKTGWAKGTESYIKTALELLENTSYRLELAHNLPKKMNKSIAGNPQKWVQEIFSALEKHIKIL